jgi:hypothetical protein
MQHSATTQSKFNCRITHIHMTKQHRDRKVDRSSKTRTILLPSRDDEVISVTYSGDERSNCTLILLL